MKIQICLFYFSLSVCVTFWIIQMKLSSSSSAEMKQKIAFSKLKFYNNNKNIENKIESSRLPIHTTRCFRTELKRKKNETEIASHKHNDDKYDKHNMKCKPKKK